MREGETLLGNITENDILGNMDDIDFDNIDLNELLMDGDDDEDDEDTNDNTAFGGSPPKMLQRKRFFSY